MVLNLRWRMLLNLNRTMLLLKEVEVVHQKIIQEEHGGPRLTLIRFYSEYCKILEKSDYLTGDTVRDKWLGKLLQGIEYVCDSKDYGKYEHKEKCGSLSLEKETSLWPDVAVTTIIALEKASHDAFSGDSEKYIKIVR